mmetsp:Transcript_42529/g.136440  ORF Transcript_42529/g.136440 Transcript_42529/m.136440 type:complete len:244 (+) Transcript_42529:1055-1786(+)
MHQHPQGPEVHLLAVAQVVDELGGHIIHRPAHRISPVLRAELDGQAEVCHLDIPPLVEQNIFELDVAVRHSPGVHVLQRKHHARRVELCLGLGDLPAWRPLLHVHEVPAVRKLDEHVRAPALLLFPVGTPHSEAKGVVEALHDLHLLPYPPQDLPVILRGDVEDLKRKFKSRGLVAHQLHPAVAPVPKDRLHLELVAVDCLHGLLDEAPFDCALDRVYQLGVVPCELLEAQCQHRHRGNSLDG